MCYFCWASHIERTDNLFQLRRAAAPVTAEGLSFIGSHHPLKNPQDWLIVKEGNRGPAGSQCEAAGRTVGVASWLPLEKSTTEQLWGLSPEGGWLSV